MTRQQQDQAIFSAYLEAHKAHDRTPGSWRGPWARSRAFKAAQRALGPVVEIGAAEPRATKPAMPTCGALTDKPLCASFIKRGRSCRRPWGQCGCQNYPAEPRARKRKGQKLHE